MPPRYSWKGFIRLSLVTIPVRSYNAVETSQEIHLHQLHKPPCYSRIRYKKACPIHGEVSKDDIVSGYEYAKDQYVVVEPDEMDKLYRESDKAITIDGFIPPDAIDPTYFTGRTNYLVPDGSPGQKPYQLLQKAMSDEDLTAMCRVVLHGREEVLLLRPVDRLLVMTMLNYGEEVRKPGDFEEELTATQAEEDEVALTKTLIDARRLGSFDYSRYKDTHHEKLAGLIEAKVQGKEIVAPPPSEEPRVIDLMDALKKSLAEVRGEGGREAAPAAAEEKKMAPSARSHAPKRKRKTG
jgi:DNA end-binding protein Ku